MTSALLDRLTHRCHILEFAGESYRFRQSLQRQTSPAVVTASAGNQSSEAPVPEEA
jgi:hypothetical protein